MSGHAAADLATQSPAGTGSGLPSTAAAPSTGSATANSEKSDAAKAEPAATAPGASSPAPASSGRSGNGDGTSGTTSQKSGQEAHASGAEAGAVSQGEGAEGGSEVSALRVQDGNKPSQPKMLDKLYTCKWKNGTLQTARVVERRLDKFGNWEYYMHYEDFDRRLDEWVGADRLGDEVIKHRSSGEVASAESNQKMTRTQKRRFDEIHTTMPVDNDPTTAALEHEREQATKVKNIQTVELGKYEMETWYYSPYPEEFSKCAKLFLCEFCLKYFRKSKTLERHKGKCEWRHPPGDEVYRHDNVSMFEVDGKKAKIYCQVLPLLPP